MAISKLYEKYKISVVIPNYNGESILEKNLPKVISAWNNPSNHIIEVIVVDDKSTDGSVGLLKTKFPKVKLIKHIVNRGFSSSVNTGVRMAKGNLIALLNSDVIPEEIFLVSVIAHFDNSDVFAVSLHEQNYFWAKGVFKDGYIGHEPGYSTDKPHISFWVSGGSGVFRRDYWVKLGGMDEKLLSPFYWEDIDLCYRAAKRGYVMLWDPDGKVIHQHETTISKLSKKYVESIRQRNHLLFIWKNLTSPNLFRKHIAGLFTRVVKHPGYLRIVLKAFMKIGIVLKARKKEKKESKISDEAIFAKFT